MPLHSEHTTQVSNRAKRRRRSSIGVGLTETVTTQHFPQGHRRQSLSISSSPSTSTSRSITTTQMHPTDDMSADGRFPRRRGKRGHSSTVSPYVLSQRLNNQGVLYIQSGQHEKAIFNIVKAFKLSQMDNSMSCTPSFSLSSVLHHHFLHCDKASLTSDGNPSEESMESDGVDDRDDAETGHTSLEAHYLDGEYVYSKGIVVPEEYEGHFMGQIFHAILAFNLALAYHLSWATRRDPSNTDRMEHMVHLYELAYRLSLQLKTDDRSQAENGGICNLRFTLIIMNNLSQLYRFLNEEKDYHAVLENVLSQLMIVATLQQQISRVRSNENLDQSIRATLATMEFCCMNLNGFFENVTPLLLKKNGAGAA